MLYRWIAIVVAAVGYASLRMSVTTYSSGDSLSLYNLTTPGPFSRRVLPRLLAYPLVEWGGLCVDDVFWLLEFGAVIGLLVAALAVFRLLVGERVADLAAFGLLPVAGMIQLAPAPVLWFAPYDTPAMAFTMTGFYLALRGRYGWLALLCIPAALNRETALMLPCIAVALRPEAWRRALPALATVLAVRVGVVLALPDVGAIVMVEVEDGPWLVVHNLRYLTRAPTTGAAMVLVHLSGLPLLWAMVWRDIPADLRRLGWVCLAVFAGMMVVGSVGEVRVFGEAVVLAFVPVVVGAVACVRRDHAVLH